MLEEISELRSIPSAPILGQRVRRSLLRIMEDRIQRVRRSLLRIQRVHRGHKLVSECYTTERFLKLFELDSLGDLPQSENLDRE